MYEELVERLKIAADWAGKGFRITPNLCLEAADAIEKLSGLISRYCGETGIKSEKSKMEDHCDVSVDFGFTCEVCSLSKYNVNTVFDTGCEGDSEICERFDPID